MEWCDVEEMGEGKKKERDSWYGIDIKIRYNNGL